MGEVFLAYDHELDRRVAIKVLRAQASEQAATRLVREAQALARLSHPNVVAVHEVSQTSGRVFVVMEYVAGGDLRAWLKARGLVGQPATRAQIGEILELMRQAGRGLAAAHRAGLLHRDVKPDNIFVGDDGRVRIGDFGLARIDESARVSEARSDDEGPTTTPSVLSAQLTVPGVAAGTPAYMAPEQRAGEVDARSDIFAFGVTFWEAVMGERPFGGEAALIHAQKALGQGRPPPAGHRAPSWLIDALQRCLVPDPAGRWPTMDALLAELEAAPRRRGRRLAAAGLGVALIAGGLGALEVQRALAARCTGAAEQLVGVWDPPRRGRIEAAFAATKATSAADTWARVGPKIDAYADQWIAAHQDACAASSVRGELSAAMMDLRMACLDRARQELDAAAAVLESADPKLILRAYDVVVGLPPLERCADLQALKAEVEPPRPEEAATVERARGELASARASRRAGRYPDALAAVDRADAAAAAAGYGPLRAELVVDRGVVLDKLGRFDEADAALRQGLADAVRHGQRRLAAEAGVVLLAMVGSSMARPAEGLRYREIVEGLVDGEPELEAVLSDNLGNIHGNEARYAEAEAAYQRSLALREARRDRDPVGLAGTLTGYARILQRTGRDAEAKAALERALELLEGALGPEHPLGARILHSLAIVHFDLEDYAQSRAYNERALAIRRAALGPEHPQVASSLNNLANVLYFTREYERARVLLEEAIALEEKTLGPEHPEVGGSLSNLADVLCALGECAAALPLIERASAIFSASEGPRHPDAAGIRLGLAEIRRRLGDLEIARDVSREALGALEEVLGPDHPSVTKALVVVADVDADLGELDRADAGLRRALRAQEAAAGPESPTLVGALVRLVRVDLRRGRVDEATALGERALALAERGDNPVALADARFALARAVVDRPDRRELALALARDARAAYAAAGVAGSPALAEVDRWLADAGRPRRR